MFGSTIDGDNRFAEDAHIGYWSDLERKYKTVAGQIEFFGKLMLLAVSLPVLSALFEVLLQFVPGGIG